jgi:hypothetical protein
VAWIHPDAGEVLDETAACAQCGGRTTGMYVGGREAPLTTAAAYAVQSAWRGWRVRRLRPSPAAVIEHYPSPATPTAQEERPLALQAEEGPEVGPWEPHGVFIAVPDSDSEGDGLPESPPRLPQPPP